MSSTGGSRTVGARIFSSGGAAGPTGPAGAPGADGTDATVVNVATIAALTALSLTGLVTGQLAYMDSLKSYWKLDTASAATTDAITIIATSGAGRWIRIREVADPYWLTTYIAGGAFIDPAGSDENTGTAAGAGTALKTFAEFRRRLQPNVLLPLTSTLLITVAAGTYAEIVDMRGVVGPYHFLCEETVVTSGTLNSATVLNRGANTHTQLGTAAFDFTSHVRKFVVLTSGASTGARGVVESIPGANQAQCSALYTQASLLSPTIVEPITPAGTETFDIRVPGVIVNGILQGVQDRGLTLSSGVFTTPTFTGFQFEPEGSTTTNRVSGGGLFNRCRFDVKASGPALTTQVDGNGAYFVIGCVTNNVTANDSAQWLCSACCVFGNQIPNFPGAVIQLDADTLMSDARAFINIGLLQLGKVGFHNTTASRHAVDGSGSPSGGYTRFISGGAIYGSLAGATSDGFKLGQGTRINANAIVPTLTVTGVAARFPTGTTKTFAELTATGYADLDQLASWVA